MPTLDRRRFLKLATFAPALPHFLVSSAQALEQDSYEGNVLVVVRMIGGNDGLNAVIPFRDDRYYKGRPTIAIPRDKARSLPGADLALHPSLGDIGRLMEEGYAAILQNVGYPNSSRSHIRSTEIWETASLSRTGPPEGWLGRYLDALPSPGAVSGLEFGESLGRTLQSRSRSARSIGHPQVLLSSGQEAAKPSSPRPALQRLYAAQNQLVETRQQLQRALKGSGTMFAYPDTAFGASLRWTANMIESGCPTRLFYATLGSFDPGAFSFDTHLDELAAHQALYAELGDGLRAFTEQLIGARQFGRVQLLTFSDFGRQVAENSSGGTDHGDASVLFALGGKIHAGLHGAPPDIAGAHDGGLKAKIDFRQVYANVLQQWLKVDPLAILGESVEPYSLVA